MSAWRHRTKCLKYAIEKASEKLAEKQGLDLLEVGREWVGLAHEGLKETAKNKDFRTMPGMLGAGAKAVELVARLECRPGFGDAVAAPATVQIALVRIPELAAGAQQQVIDVGGSVRGQLVSGAILEGDCEESGEHT